MKKLKENCRRAPNLKKPGADELLVDYGVSVKDVE